MSEEIKKEQEGTPADWLLSAAVKFSEASLFGKMIGGMVIIILALQISGLSVWTITDKWFWLKETELTKSFDLQLRQLDLTENQIIPRLDDILKRLENVENRVSWLESRTSDHNRRLDQLEKKVK